MGKNDLTLNYKKNSPIDYRYDIIKINNHKLIQ